MSDSTPEPAACGHRRLFDMGAGGVICAECLEDRTFYVFPFVTDGELADKWRELWRCPACDAPLHDDDETEAHWRMHNGNAGSV